MGKSKIVKYVVAVYENPNQLIPNRIVYDGKPNKNGLDNWVDAYVQSLKSGGVNYHITESLGYIPIPCYAELIDQVHNSVVASRTAPMFMAF